MRLETFFCVQKFNFSHPLYRKQNFFMDSPRGQERRGYWGTRGRDRGRDRREGTELASRVRRFLSHVDQELLPFQVGIPTSLRALLLTGITPFCSSVLSAPECSTKYTSGTDLNAENGIRAIRLMRVSLWLIRRTGSWRYLAGSWRETTPNLIVIFRKYFSKMKQ